MTKQNQQASTDSNQAEAPRRRRTRGPNKPKDAAITVKTEASMCQAEIVKILQGYVSKMLGTDTAADMEIQIGKASSQGNTWTSVGAVAGDGSTVIRFATKGMR